ncbi:MAG: rod shape-determining protein MreC [candidate division NC10 bacterium]|nr:rod shape-determining protein MreC [candidate division NC10 bacterium]
MSPFFRLLARYRRGVVLTTTLIVAFLLLSLQVRHERTVVTAVRQALLTVLSPPITIAALAVQGVRDVWTGYIDLRAIRQENLRLKGEVAVLKRRIDQLAEQALETQRLQRLLALHQAAPVSLISARVIGKDATNWFKTVLLDRGSADGVRRNLPVVTPDGLVGRVVEVTPTASKVQLLTDPVSAAGGLLQRTRVTGIVVGSFAVGARVRYLPLMADVGVGDEVVTSGMGGVFPKGIPIGRITAVERKSGALFQEATLQPAVNFSRLEEAMVLMDPAPREGFEAEGW